MAAESGKTRTTEPKAASGNGESRSPEQIQGEIEATREEMGDTVAELADKTDVKKQAKRKVAETKAKATAKKEEVQQKVAAQTETVTKKVKASSPDSAQEAAGAAQAAAAQTTQAARENPVPTAALAGFAGGLVVGWMLGRR
jgi:ElaB/YqjD/DUF883 family membrane-anchored ribosome-binding protein